jgi:hypothetical protein
MYAAGPLRSDPLCLGVCEFYNPTLHGECDDARMSDYLFYTCQVGLADFYDGSVFEYLSDYPGALKYTGVVRAYWNIVSRPNAYPMLEIVQPVTLEPGGECVAVLKTFWLRLIQRKWKRIFAERRQRLAKLIKPYGLMQREIGSFNIHHMKSSKSISD